MSRDRKMEGQKEDFKWFGEGFDGFPKSLPEDCVEYSVYVIDSKLKDHEIQEQLRQVQSAARKLTDRLLKDYIWQREGIHFAMQRGDGHRFLRGRTDYGDAVEDEWLIVYVIRELSKQFPRVWIRVVDTDGEFLLIEAANVLPRWLNPEIAEFRVWLNRGNLCLIPLNKNEAKIAQAKPEPKPLFLKEALEFIELHPSDLIRSPTVEAEAFYRLQKYPRQIQDSLHRGLVTIPRKLAFILHENASYISPATEAFYLRDPISMRPLQARDTARLNFPPLDLVTMSAKFTKVGYAQLKSQQIDAPASWTKVPSTKMDPKSQEKAMIGMRVACGFEMLLSDPQHQDKKSVREIKLLLEDLESGAESLPSDAKILSWGLQEDSEEWLDINFEEFEKELAGKKVQGVNGAFGDKNAQDNLRKMVARFEDFLNDDAAGADGAGYLDDMDNDDGETTSDDSSTDSGDKDVSFDEDEFSRMMREMMGMPAKSETADNYKIVTETVFSNDERPGHVSSDEDEVEGISRAMHDIEQELRDKGALKLGQTADSEVSALQPKVVNGVSSGLDQPDASSNRIIANHEEVDIDFNLAGNLLESFKSQGGVSGPGGNLMGLMGMHMPRDEQ